MRRDAGAVGRAETGATTYNNEAWPLAEVVLRWQTGKDVRISPGQPHIPHKVETGCQ